MTQDQNLHFYQAESRKFQKYTFDIHEVVGKEYIRGDYIEL